MKYSGKGCIGKTGGSRGIGKAQPLNLLVKVRPLLSTIHVQLRKQKKSVSRFVPWDNKRYQCKRISPIEKL